MAAAATFRNESITSPAVLGKDVTILGEIRSHEPLIIEGEVQGTVDVAGHLLTIASNGTVRASIKAKEIEVQGSLEGDIEGADKIYIRNGARVVGDIRAHGLVIEDGGFIKGKVDLSQKSR
jgi:cytoskeletal protein CcmA (bactofilin family)